MSFRKAFWAGICLSVLLFGSSRGFAQTGPQAVSTQSIQQINHIIFMVQENRSFDHYFGAMRQYWAQNGYPDQSFDGLRQFNPKSGARPLHGAPPFNPGCDPAFPAPNDCTIDSQSPKIKSFKL